MSLIKIRTSNYLFYTSSVLFVGIYFLDWIMGIQHQFIDLVWAVFSLILLIYFILYSIKIKTNLKNICLLLGLMLLFLLGVFGAEHFVKKYTLGEIVFHMEGASTPSSDLIKVRKKGDDYYAYFSSSFFISTSYSKYRVNIVEPGKFTLKNNKNILSFECADASCYSKLGSFNVYVDNLFNLPTSG